jgi:hypothetical protein
MFQCRECGLHYNEKSVAGQCGGMVQKAQKLQP